jgi:phage terminase small subunit
MKGKINPRQEQFCQNYAECGNASKAYRDAYKGALGAGVSAFHLLKNPKIQKRIEEITGETAKRNDISKDELLAWWMEVRDTPVGEIDQDHPLAQEVTVGDSGIKIKMPSKERAMMEIARLTGAYEPEKKEIGLDDDLAEIIRLATGGKE